MAETALRNASDNFCSFRIEGVFRRRQCLQRERVTRHAIDQKADAGRVFGEAGEIFGSDLAGVFAELFGEALGIIAADLEGDDRADVAEDGVGGGLVQLSQVLVRHDQRQTVFAGFAEHRCKTARCEILSAQKVSECAGINRFGIENESILRRRFSQLLRPSAEGRFAHRNCLKRPCEG